MKKRKPNIIPSRTALRYVSHILRSFQHLALKDAILFERAGAIPEANSVRLQAADLGEVALFLEEKITGEGQ
jgi:hypothetical protein